MWRCFNRRYGENCTSGAPVSHIQVSSSSLSSSRTVCAACSQLWSEISSLTRDVFSQENFVRINTFPTFGWIPNVWFLESVIKKPNKTQSQPDVNEIWIALFKAWNWQWYLKPENDTHAARGRGTCLVCERGRVTQHWHILFVVVLHIKPLYLLMPQWGACPHWRLFLFLGIIITSFSQFLQCSVFSSNLWKLFISILFTRDKMLIPWHFKWWGEKEGKEGRKTYMIYSFIIPRHMGSHLFTWLTCLDLITTHS